MLASSWVCRSSASSTSPPPWLLHTALTRRVVRARSLCMISVAGHLMCLSCPSSTVSRLPCVHLSQPHLQTPNLMMDLHPHLHCPHTCHRPPPQPIPCQHQHTCVVP